MSKLSWKAKTFFHPSMPGKEKLFFIAKTQQVKIFFD